MPRFKVEAILKGIDKISGPVSRIQRNVRKFTRIAKRGVDAANRSLNKFGGAIKSASLSVFKFGSAMAAALGAATVAAIYKVANAADTLAKTSRRLDFPIEALQEWQFVAEQSGVSNELLNSSLAAFSKRLGEAKVGTGALVTFLKKSNPQLLEQLINTKDVSKAFEIYLDAIRKAPNAQDKAAIASAGFSRAGLKLINITHNSADAVAALRREQIQNGIITLEQAENAEKFNDALNSLKKSIGGLIQNALLPIIPKLTEYILLMREIIISNKEVVKSKILEYFKSLKIATLSLWDSLKRLNREYQFVDKIEELITKLPILIKYISENSDKVLAWTKVIIGLVIILKILGVVLAVVNAIMYANPIVLITIAVIAAIVAITLLVNKLYDMGGAFRILSLGILFALGPIGLIIGMGLLIYKNWGKITELFKTVFGTIVDWVTKGIDAVKEFYGILQDIGGLIQKYGIFNLVSGFASKFFSGKDQENNSGPSVEPSVVSPATAISRSIEERNTNNSAEITIKDESGKAEVTKSPKKNSGGLSLQFTGGF